MEDLHIICSTANDLHDCRLFVQLQIIHTIADYLCTVKVILGDTQISLVSHKIKDFFSLHYMAMFVQ